MTGKVPSGRLGQGLGAYLPPIHDRRFWFTQGLVLVVSIAHAVVHIAVGGLPDVLVLILYTFPVIYAALEFGFRGSVATTALIVVLSLPFVIHDALSGVGSDFVGHLVELAILVVVAPVVGRVVESERAARRAHEVAEIRYRALFEASGVPALVLDEQGCIQEANPAAASLLQGELQGRHLSQVLGMAAADAILGGDPPQRLDVSSGLALRPIVSAAVGEAGERLAQVLFQDVTEETAGSRRTRAFALAVLVAQEDERRRIAQELHDEALQLVVELRRRVERVVRSSPPDCAGGEELLAARSLADAVIEELRTVAVRLRPPDLADLGLTASLERLVAEARRRGTPAEIEVEGREPALPPDFALSLYRVAQEALTNAEHHARAQHVGLRLDFSDSSAVLVVEDDGVGFVVGDAAASEANAHLGLLGMRERLQLVGGTLEITSAVGEGTTVAAAVRL